MDARPAHRNGSTVTLAAIVATGVATVLLSSCGVGARPHLNGPEPYLSEFPSASLHTSTLPARHPSSTSRNGSSSAGVAPIAVTRPADQTRAGSPAQPQPAVRTSAAPGPTPRPSPIPSRTPAPSGTPTAPQPTTSSAPNPLGSLISAILNPSKHG